MIRDIPAGLVGVRARDPILVHVSTGVKGSSGAPTAKGRFWITTQTTRSADFVAGSGKAYRSLRRDPAPGFEAWNDEARRLGANLPPAGAGRVGILRGNLVHARWQDAAFWNRAAQKLGEGHPAPPSKAPACEGNGIMARRYKGTDKDVEVYETIPCPNQDCPFAMNGACKPSAHLIFQLRWDASDPWQAQFPSLLAEWNTTGWRSLGNMVGLLAFVLGTEALLTTEERAHATPEQRAAWDLGLAPGLGIANPSLVGMPFVMSVGEATKAADARSAEGKRFTVVNFSPDGDLVAWLLAQRRQREALMAAPETRALPPVRVQDREFLDDQRHASRVEIDPINLEPVTAE